jgi:hypothetical protein
MPYTERRSGASGQPSSAGAAPVARSLACVVLLALLVLVALRHVFGGIDIRAGVN